MRKVRIYLASPLGFSEAGKHFYYKKLVPALKSVPAEVIDPWKLTPEALINPILAMPYGPKRKRAWEKLNRIIGANNASGIEKADGTVAVLDGVDVDSGTASEIAYTCALNKFVIGYRGDFRLASDNDGCKVNLQVEYFIYRSGGDIVTSLGDVIQLVRRMAVKLGLTVTSKRS